MLNPGIAAALVLGILGWRVGLPPLVGFLLTGFLLSAFGYESPALLTEIADAGVLMLLFTVGLKLRITTLFRKEVCGSAIVHLVILTSVVSLALVAGIGVSSGTALMIAVALGLSSTVLAAKVLESSQGAACRSRAGRDRLHVVQLLHPSSRKRHLNILLQYD